MVGAGCLRDPRGRLIAVPDALVEFIEARLAEDEEAAQACEDSDGGRVWYASRDPSSAGYVVRTQGSVVARIEARRRPGAVAAFIAAHDPYRALRRVRVLRTVLADFSRAAEQERLLASPAGDKSARYEFESGRAIALRVVLRGIAAAEWGEHPGYGAAIEGF
jgi:hypothetical protein